ncbi:MAG: hypothetical protein HWQ38_07960 [Nostoc sp. NMS7]|uniref:hypothetical protein n=1 Tax=Nostoc sp. NMS7 TaxID=2815391 RepID=UPI0025D2F4E9|nr:hypothetical protein [Nostoc sp. NMS7]MBN3946416.1 hypothetical protein [Nostoc sp. NMS7]
MFRLTSTNLPLVATQPRPAPSFTIWSGENRGTGLVLRVNFYGNWIENPGWELDAVPLGKPFATGKYYVTPFTPVIQQIAQYVGVENAIASSPNTFWQSATSLSLYQGSTLPANAVVTSSVSAPPAVANNYIFSTSIAVSSITSGGLTFTNGTGIGNFSQNGQIVTIYGDAAYSLILGQELVVIGDVIPIFLEAISAIASFYLPDTVYCDRIDWVGKSFSPARDALSPQIWEFTWDVERKVANLFLPSTSMPYWTESHVDYILNSSGVVDFNR